MTDPIAERPIATPPSEPLGLCKQWREDLSNHYGDWSRPGFRALAVYRFGRWRQSIRPRLLRMPLSFLFHRLHRWTRNGYGIELPDSVQVGRNVTFEHQHGIVIHGDATIGDGCYIRQGVTLGNRSLDRPRDAPTLGQNVNVGAGAKILGDVIVGDGATIGANAVVVKDVPAGAIAVGIPARILEKANKPSDSATAQEPADE